MSTRCSGAPTPSRACRRAGAEGGNRRREFLLLPRGPVVRAALSRLAAERRHRPGLGAAALQGRFRRCPRPTKETEAGGGGHRGKGKRGGGGCAAASGVQPACVAGGVPEPPPRKAGIRPTVTRGGLRPAGRQGAGTAERRMLAGAAAGAATEHTTQLSSEFCRSSHVAPVKQTNKRSPSPEYLGEGSAQSPCVREQP